MVQTKTILTNYGNEQILKAIAEGTEVVVSAMVYGDGGGSSYEPVMSQTSLINQIGSINSVTKNYDEIDDFIYFNATIPANYPECIIRELGLVDDTNQLLAISVIPDTSKPDLEEGLEVTLPISIGFKTSTGEVMVVPVGPGSDYPDKDWVNERIEIAVSNRANVNLTNLTTAGNNKILPSQSGNSGKILTTNGTRPSWITSPGANKDLSNLTPEGESHFANAALSSLSTEGEDRLHALKGYLESGKSYSDKTLYNDVYKYSRSTFDISNNLTVIAGGSAVTYVELPFYRDGLSISTDGITRGFSSNNYVTTYLSSAMYEPWGAPWTFYSPTMVTTNLESTETYAVFSSNLRISKSYSATASDSVILVRLKPVNAEFSVIDTNIKVVENERYQVKIEYTGTQYLISVKTGDNGFILTNTIQSLGRLAPSSDIMFGSTNIGYMWTQGYLDLRTIRFIYNGDLITSGSKRSIDIIKPDSYAPSSEYSPAITDGGIASDFSASDFLVAQFAETITLSKNTYFEVDIRFKTPTSWTKIGELFAYDNSGVLSFGHTADGKLSASFIGSGINTSSIQALATNTVYEAKFIYDSTGFYVKYKQVSNTAWLSSTPTTVTSDESCTLRGAIGNREEIGHIGHPSEFFEGSIDLNSLKIFVKNSLVYQACLRVPYNPSSTGSKIVDISYKYRLIDIYEQFGSALYYMIDDVNEAASLPLGELYGFIDSKSGILPDWSRAINKSPYTLYTATQRGWLNVIGYTNQDPIGVKINGNIVAFAKAPGSNDSTGFGCLVPINVGDKYIAYTDRTGGASSSVYIDSIKFIPCKGDANVIL